MECDELIEQKLKDETDKSLDKHRERLATLVGSGKCSEYLGKKDTIEKCDNMTNMKKLKNCTRVSLDWELP